MNPFLKKCLWALLALPLLGVLLFTSYYREALFYKPQSVAEVRALLEPHMQLLRPDGLVPQPLVVSFHGCGGMQDYNLPRAQKLVEAGYAVLVIDSFSGRSIDTKAACAGTTFQGAERAGDVHVALQIAREIPDIDHNRMFIQGFSHGAWTVLEALAAAENGAPSLRDMIANPLEGVVGAVAWYPYCGFGTNFQEGWNSDVPVLMLLAGKDETTAPEPCIEVAERQQRRGGPMEMRLYPEATHGFDVQAEWVINYDPATHAKAMLQVLGFLSRHRSDH